MDQWVIMNSFPKPIVAAINGHSPGGGCILALASDVRVMARQKTADATSDKTFVIGLNEAKLGLTVSQWLAEAYAYVLGGRTAERLLQTGELLPADEALRLGLVDAVTADAAACVETAFQEAERLLTVPPAARARARDYSRSTYMRHLATPEARERDTQVMSSLVMDEELQANLEAYVAQLRERSRK